MLPLVVLAFVALGNGKWTLPPVVENENTALRAFCAECCIWCVCANVRVSDERESRVRRPVNRMAVCRARTG